MSDGHSMHCARCGSESNAGLCDLCIRDLARLYNNKIVLPQDLDKKSIPSEMLSRLIRLCHPDKHGNSEAANAATKWLLSLLA